MFGAPTLLARAREAMREGQTVHGDQPHPHFFRRAFLRPIRAPAATKSCAD